MSEFAATEEPRTGLVVGHPSMSAVTYIAANLRDRDVAEFQAVFGPDVDIAGRLLAITAMGGVSYTVWHDGQPVFMFGVVVPRSPGHIGTAWGFGTDKAWRAIPEAGRVVKEHITPLLLQHGIRRVEVRVLSANRSSVHWLYKYLGAKFETKLPDYGVNGETFLQFAWTKGNNNHVLPDRPASGASPTKD